MDIFIISTNNYVEDALKQIVAFNEYSFKTVSSIDAIECDPLLVIFDSITPNEKYNYIHLSNHIHTKPIKLYYLIQLINDKISQKTYRIQTVDFIPNKRLLVYNKKSISLTEKETDLMSYLFKNSPQSIGKGKIMQDLWNYSADTESNTFEVHVCRLKNKLLEANFPNFLVFEKQSLKIIV